MPDVAPPAPPHPKVAAKGIAGLFKGKPAWMWVAGVTFVFGVAFMVYRRQQAVAADIPDPGTADETGDTTANVGPVGGDYGYVESPAPTQGAFGGYDAPVPEPPAPAGPTTVNVSIPGPAVTVHDVVPATKTTKKHPTGGGHPARGVHHHKPPPKPKHHKPKVTPKRAPRGRGKRKVPVRKRARA